MSVTTGIGWDVHRLAAGRELVLGGVRIEHDSGLDGHSDADVLAHAVIDALLGAAGLGDIGEHFPDTDAAFAGADSIALSSDAHVPDDLGYGYDRALEVLDAVGVREIATFERRRRTLEPVG